MNSALGSSLPTRSEIENWDTDDLDTAASRWRQIADHSEAAFDEHRANIVNTDWSGDAKDAAVDKATAAAAVVGNQNQIIRDSAAIAENGSGDVMAAKQAALNAIAEAEADGFKVGEDLSVSDTRRVDILSMSARLTAATEHAEDIRWNAQQLVQTDTLIGNRLTANAQELGAIHFLDSEEGSGSNGVFQAVDYKESPIPNPAVPGDPVAPTAADIQGVLAKLPNGSPDVSEVRSVQELDKLWEWLKKNGTEIPSRYGDPSKGTWIELPDGTIVGRRNAARSTAVPALDINIPNSKGNLKVHVNPSRGGSVSLPAPAKVPIPEPAPKSAAPAPSAPKAPSPPVRAGGPPLVGGVGELPVPRLVHPPGHIASDPDLPVLGDGIPDYPDN